VKQKEIWYTDLNPSKGSEQAGFRPVVIISGNLVNQYLNIVICCPLTSKIKDYKGNVVLIPNKQNNLKLKSEILTFQIRSLAKVRLKKKVGEISEKEFETLRLGLNDLLTY